MSKRTKLGEKKKAAEEERRVANRISQNIRRVNTRLGYHGNIEEDSLLHQLNSEIPQTFFGHFIQATIRVGVGRIKARLGSNSARY